MGIAFYRVWIKGAGRRQAKSAMIIFGIHLVLNALWSIIFFGWHNVFLALITILVMAALVIWLIRLFGRIDKIAGWLLIPYIAWICLAIALNFSVWRLNG